MSTKMVTSNYETEIEVDDTGNRTVRRLSQVYSYLLMRRDEELTDEQDAGTNLPEQAEAMHEAYGRRSQLEHELWLLEQVGKKYAEDGKLEEALRSGYGVRLVCGVRWLVIDERGKWVVREELFNQPSRVLLETSDESAAVDKLLGMARGDE
jgi:hypothetical protein